MPAIIGFAILGNITNESVSAVTIITSKVTLTKNNPALKFSRGSALCNALKKAALKKRIKNPLHIKVNLVELIFHDKNWVAAFEVLSGVDGLCEKNAIRSSEISERMLRQALTYTYPMKKTNKYQVSINHER